MLVYSCMLYNIHLRIWFAYHKQYGIYVGSYGLLKSYWSGSYKASKVVINWQPLTGNYWLAGNH